MARRLFFSTFLLNRDILTGSTPATTYGFQQFESPSLTIRMNKIFVMKINSISVVAFTLAGHLTLLVAAANTSRFIEFSMWYWLTATVAIPAYSIAIEATLLRFQLVSRSAAFTTIAVVILLSSIHGWLIQTAIAFV